MLGAVSNRLSSPTKESTSFFDKKSQKVYHRRIISIAYKDGHLLAMRVSFFAEIL